MSDTFDEFWDRGFELYHAGKFEEAIAEWREANRLDPEDGYVVHNIARALSELGQDEAAIVEWQSAIRLEPNYAAPHTKLAFELATAERYPEALTAIRAALRLSPDDADLYALLGRQLLVAAENGGGQAALHEALTSLQAAVKIEPENAYAFHVLGIVEWRLGQKRKAIETLKASIRLDPTDAAVYSNLYELQIDAFDMLGMVRTVDTISKLPDSEELEQHYKKIERLWRRTKFDLCVVISLAAVVTALAYWNRRR